MYTHTLPSQTSIRLWMDFHRQEDSSNLFYGAWTTGPEHERVHAGDQAGQAGSFNRGT